MGSHRPGWCPYHSLGLVGGEHERGARRAQAREHAARVVRELPEEAGRGYEVDIEEEDQLGASPVPTGRSASIPASTIADFSTRTRCPDMWWKRSSTRRRAGIEVSRSVM